MCPAELYEGIQYPETAPNTPAMVPCPPGQSGSYIRLCGATGVWSNPTNNCRIFFLAYLVILRGSYLPR